MKPDTMSRYRRRAICSPFAVRGSRFAAAGRHVGLTIYTMPKSNPFRPLGTLRLCGESSSPFTVRRAQGAGFGVRGLEFRGQNSDF
jgi:hypothetical protein